MDDLSKPAGVSNIIGGGVRTKIVLSNDENVESLKRILKGEGGVIIVNRNGLIKIAKDNNGLVLSKAVLDLNQDRYLEVYSSPITTNPLTLITKTEFEKEALYLLASCARELGAKDYEFVFLDTLSSAKAVKNESKKKAATDSNNKNQLKTNANASKACTKQAEIEALISDAEKANSMPTNGTITTNIEMIPGNYAIVNVENIGDNQAYHFPEPPIRPSRESYDKIKRNLSSFWIFRSIFESRLHLLMNGMYSDGESTEGITWRFSNSHKRSWKISWMLGSCGRSSGTENMVKKSRVVRMQITWHSPKRFQIPFSIIDRVQDYIGNSDLEFLKDLEVVVNMVTKIRKGEEKEAKLIKEDITKTSTIYSWNSPINWVVAGPMKSGKSSVMAGLEMILDKRNIRDLEDGGAKFLPRGKLQFNVRSAPPNEFNYEDLQFYEHQGNIFKMISNELVPTVVDVEGYSAYSFPKLSDTSMIVFVAPIASLISISNDNSPADIQKRYNDITKLLKGEHVDLLILTKIDGLASPTLTENNLPDVLKHLCSKDNWNKIALPYAKVVEQAINIKTIPTLTFLFEWNSMHEVYDCIHFGREFMDCVVKQHELIISEMLSKMRVKLEKRIKKLEATMPGVYGSSNALSNNDKSAIMST